MRHRRDRTRARRMLEGDGEEGRLWVTEQYPRLLRFLRHLTGSADAAEDLTQSAFVKAWEGLGSYRGESSLSTWLHRIAYHEYTHWIRSRRVHSSLEDLHTPDVPANQLDGLLLRQALARLTPEHRETFLLRHVQGFSVGEVAAVMEVPTGTVKSRLFHARAQLRILLSEPKEVPCHEAP